MRVFGDLFVMLFAKKEELGLGLKLGISVPKRYGNAVLRNRFKRIVREVVRHDAELKSLSYNMIIAPNLRSNSAKWPNLSDMRRSFDLLKCGLNS